ncbi:peptidase M24, structural domain-containing protein [Entophlyctis helioformis]|nr:peptidase M24, structural domain-containing protein [Entophlyctis helioformis]
MLGQPTGHSHPHLLKPDELTIGIRASEYAARRQRLADKIGIDAVAVVPGYGLRYATNGIFYPFHQSTNMLYLTGFNEPDCGCTIESGRKPGQRHKYTLYVQPTDRRTQIWDGPRSGLEGATSHFGAGESVHVDQFERHLKLLNALPDLSAIYSDLPLTRGAETGLLNGTHIRPEGGSATHPLAKVIDQLRLYKSPAEIALMREAGRVSGKAFVEAMRKTRGGYEVRMRGASGLAYVPVVAGGRNALIMHYVQNQQVLKDGDLLLVDAGAEYGGYASDISRTWPVSGKFTAGQRKLYDIVLRVQKQLVARCREDANTTLDELQRETCAMLEDELVVLLGRKLHRGELNTLYPHHVGHWLGMDVHDTGSVPRTTRLVPGMVVTIEPGLYIPDDPMYPAELRGTGIRIEDDVAVGGPATGGAPVVLSADTPKEVSDIEAVMGGIV